MLYYAEERHWEPYTLDFTLSRINSTSYIHSCQDILLFVCILDGIESSFAFLDSACILYHEESSLIRPLCKS